MNINNPKTDELLSLDDGGGPRLLVRAESFVEFDFAVSAGLTQMVDRWADYASPNAGRGTKSRLARHRTKPR